MAGAVIWDPKHLTCPLFLPQVSVGASPSRAEVEGPIQRSNDARSLGDQPSANSSGNGNGTLGPAASKQNKRVDASRLD